MKKYIRTTSFTYYFEENYENEESKSRNYSDGIWGRYYWNVKKGSVEKGMKELSDFCNKHGFQIMGVLPILRAQAAEEAYTFQHSHIVQGGGYGYGGGLGLGWGITMTDGFTAMLQSVEELSDEDYAKRMAEDQKRAQLIRQHESKVTKLRLESESIKKQYPAVEAAYKEKLPQIENVKLALESGIEEKKRGVLSKKVVYRFDNKGFETRAEAEELEAFTREELKKMETEAEVMSSQLRNMQKTIKDNDTTIASSTVELTKLREIL